MEVGIQNNRIRTGFRLSPESYTSIYIGTKKDENGAEILRRPSAEGLLQNYRACPEFAKGLTCLFSEE